ncbi:MAG: hypothetical protein RMI83_06275 [Desulfurococcaceae archaeon]|nr:hypothetical protein [Sulfolobales archaeon]MDW8170684.1 hypothetical protein [Desulfurococcaceae archaeon]
MRGALKPKYAMGLISFISGIELTNVVILTMFGALYGYIGLILSLAALAPFTYLQQAIAIFGKTFGKPPSSALADLSKWLQWLYLDLVIASSLIILFVNIASFSAIASSVIGGSWLHYALLLTGCIMAVGNTDRSGILSKATYLSLITISLYLLVLAVNSSKLGTAWSKPSVEIDFKMLLALLGASASPYSLLIQEGEACEKGVYLGSILGAFISLTVVSVSILTLHPATAFYVSDIVKPFNSLSYIAKYAYLLSIASTVLLSSISIILACSSIALRTAGLRGFYKCKSIINGLAILMIVITALISRAETSELLTQAVVAGTAIVGALTSPMLMLLAACFMNAWVKRGLKFFALNSLALLIISLVSTCLIALGLSEVITCK